MRTIFALMLTIAFAAGSSVAVGDEICAPGDLRLENSGQRPGEIVVRIQGKCGATLFKNLKKAKATESGEMLMRGGDSAGRPVVCESVKGDSEDGDCVFNIAPDGSVSGYAD